MADKLEGTEKVLREISKHNDNYRQRVDRMQIDMDRLVLELKKTKIDLALAEDRKAENEQSLKHEIKYLIEKLMNERQKQVEATGSETNYLEGTFSDCGGVSCPGSRRTSAVAEGNCSSPHSQSDLIEANERGGFLGY